MKFEDDPCRIYSHVGLPSGGRYKMPLANNNSSTKSIIPLRSHRILIFFFSWAEFMFSFPVLRFVVCACNKKKRGRGWLPGGWLLAMWHFSTKGSTVDFNTLGILLYLSICPLTRRVVGAPPMISQPVASISVWLARPFVTLERESSLIDWLIDCFKSS